MIKINKTTIELTRGDTLRVELELTRDGEAYELQDGDSIRFALKRHYYDEEPLIVKSIGDDLLLELEPQDTKDLSFGDYVYDIEMTYSDGTVDTFIAESRFTIRNEVL